MLKSRLKPIRLLRSPIVQLALGKSINLVFHGFLSISICYENSYMSFSRVYCIYHSEGRAPSPSPFSCLASTIVGAKSLHYWLNSEMEDFSADHRSQHAPSKDACSLCYVAAGARAHCKPGLTWLLTLVGVKHWLLWDWSFSSLILIFMEQQNRFKGLLWSLMI